jgi:tRNA G18 (ribose-2'-O)-methylase SpoU
MLAQNKRDSKKDPEREIYLLLHNIRSTHNVGAIFRTADAVGVKKIYISGYTPAPTDRFGRARQDISKASLGAEKTVAWESVSDIEKLIEELKKDSVKIFALEQDKNSINYSDAKTADKNLLILGNEVGGVEKDILKECDEILEIPMYGQKESLNVSVATGIVLYSLIK